MKHISRKVTPTALEHGGSLSKLQVLTSVVDQTMDFLTMVFLGMRVLLLATLFLAGCTIYESASICTSHPVLPIAVLSLAIPFSCVVSMLRGGNAYNNPVASIVDIVSMCVGMFLIGKSGLSAIQMVLINGLTFDTGFMIVLAFVGLTPVFVTLFFVLSALVVGQMRRASPSR